MTTVVEQVKAMTTEAAKGQTPAQLRKFLQENYSKRRVGWLQRWLLAPYSYDVTKVEPFNDQGFFQSSSVFWVYARDPLLERALLPHGGTCGLFALGADGLRHLNHRKDSVEELFRKEGRPLVECPLLVLALIMVEALGRQGNSGHDVIESPEQLTKYKGDLEKYKIDFGGYATDPRELDRVRADMIPITLSGDRKSGWQLEFCSVYGWMHDKQTLFRHCYRVGSDFCIDQKSDVLSYRIFSATPAITY